MKQTVEYLESFAVMALIGMGITGASYHLFRDGGWMESTAAGLWEFIVDYPLLAIAAFLSAAALTWRWRHSRQFQRQNEKAATAAFYVMIAAGMFFVGRLVIDGTL